MAIIINRSKIIMHLTILGDPTMDFLFFLLPNKAKFWLDAYGLLYYGVVA